MIGDQPHRLLFGRSDRELERLVAGADALGDRFRIAGQRRRRERGIVIRAVEAFVDDELQSTVGGRGVPGRTIEAGLGVDRKAGSYRLAGNVLWSTRRAADAESYEPELNRSDLNLVLAAERTFARETRNLRVFAVYDPVDGTSFTRVIAAISVRDNLWLEGSGGLFAGTADDTLGRLANRDFVYARLKVFF